MKRKQFMLKGRREDVVSVIEQSLVERYVRVPAFGYLELSEVKTADSLIETLGRVMSYGIKKTATSFIKEVATGSPSSPSADWQQFETDTVSLLQTASSAEEWPKYAVQKGTICRWLMFLIMSERVVWAYYEDYGALCDPYSANRIVSMVADFMEETYG